MDTFCVILKQQKQEHLKKKLFSAALIQIQKLENQTVECASTWFAGPYGYSNYLHSVHPSIHWKKDGFGKDGKVQLRKSNTFSQFLKIFLYILSQKDMI